MSRLVSRVGVSGLRAAHAGAPLPTQETQNPRSRGMNLGLCVSALGGIRTPNLLIRSQMLYPLSYERVPIGPVNVSATSDR